MLVLFLLLSLSTGDEDWDSAIEHHFNDLLKVEGVEFLDDLEREHRLSIFTVNCVVEFMGLIGSSADAPLGTPERICPRANLDYIYTQEELSAMDGMVLDPHVQTGKSPITVHKRSTEKRSVPSSYDVRDYIKLSAPLHQGLCGNCYIHAFVSSLEISYTKQTGKLIHFSRQELTDCFYKGCKGGDYRALANMVAITDHLSEASKYGEYLARHTTRRFACKASLTPDSLLDIKVVGFESITAGEVDYYVYTHGSVLACLDWKGNETNNCGTLHAVKPGEIFRGDAVPGGCTHAVLIVGYTPEYYIAKNSHGVSWGDGGYFKIERGTNACGVEDDLAVILTEPRNPSSKNLAPNNCPREFSHFCEKSKSCTSSEHCLVPLREEERVLRLRVMRQTQINRGGVVKSNSANKLSSWKFLSSNRGPSPTSSCTDLSRRCSWMSRMGLCESDLAFREVQCRQTCGVCKPETSEAEGGCVDTDSTCSQLSPALCKMVYRIRKNCPLKCNSCHLVEPSQFETKVNWNPNEPVGECEVPEIPHGTVLLRPGREYLQHGEAVDVLCDPGYVLAGEAVTCVIQHVFNPDSRLLPECVKLSSEELQGNGENYDGSRNVSVSGKPCLNWSRELIAGSTFVTPEEAGLLQNGNHNFCRNKDGAKGVPYCLVGRNLQHSTGGRVRRDLKGPDVEREFCFAHPGCDVCENAEDHVSASCRQNAASGVCTYGAMKSDKVKSYWWDHCTESCCEVAGCYLSDQ